MYHHKHHPDISYFTCGYFRLLSEITAEAASGGTGQPPGHPQLGGFDEKNTL